MFKFKKKKNYMKLTKKEQKEFLKEAIKSSIIYLIIFSVAVLGFSKDLAYAFKAIDNLTLDMKLKLIILFVPICIIIAVLIALGKLLINKK